MINLVLSQHSPPFGNSANFLFGNSESLADRLVLVNSDQFQNLLLTRCGLIPFRRPSPPWWKRRLLRPIDQGFFTHAVFSGDLAEGHFPELIVSQSTVDDGGGFHRM
jgi:hypothetical protein